MKAKLLTLYAGLVILLSAQGQQIKLGEKVPDFEFGEILNYERPSLKISDFKGKLVILDFWGFTCVSCLKSFPHIDTLQKRFKNQVQFILVNPASKTQTLEFFRTHKKVYRPDLPMICDTANILWKAFPFWGVPFYAWIDSGQVLRQRVTGEFTNEYQLRNYINGVALNLPQKPATLIFRSSLFDSSYRDGVQYASYISKCIQDKFVPVGNKGRNKYEINVSCASIPLLYQYAFNALETQYFSRPGRMAVEVHDSSNYFAPAIDDKAKWEEEHCYLYHLIWPGTDRKKAFEIMKEDLDRFFGLQAYIDRRTTNCFTLVRTTKSNMLLTRGGEPVDKLIPASVGYNLDSKVERFMINKPYKIFSDRLGTLLENRFKIPFVDSTGFGSLVGFNVDITLSGKVWDEDVDLEKLRKALHAYGLDIIRQPVTIETLILTDKLERKATANCLPETHL